MNGEVLMPTTLFDVLSLVSFVVGILGFLIGYIQFHERVRLESILTTHLAGLINESRVIIPYADELDHLLEGINKPELLKWAWIVHKGISDIYRGTVRHYLASQGQFTYLDLKNLAEAGTINTVWEERVWRDLISLRKENKEKEVPELFLKDTKPRFKWTSSSENNIPE